MTEQQLLTIKTAAADLQAATRRLHNADSTNPPLSRNTREALALIEKAGWLLEKELPEQIKERKSVEKITLNNHVIHEIQKYLSAMDWAQTEYKGEQLTVFLQGLRCALFEKGARFKMGSRRDVDYKTVFYVDVEQYADPYDCWSEINFVCRIYSNEVTYVRD